MKKTLSLKKDNSTNLVDIDKEAESESIFTLGTLSLKRIISHIRYPL